jgi:hypothetical protein
MIATTPFSKFSPKNFTDFRARSNAWIDLLSAEQPSAGLAPGETQETVYALTKIAAGDEHSGP